MCKELKHCPLCGSNNIKKIFNDGYTQVICQAELCGCMTEYETCEQDAIKAWNTRPENIYKKMWVELWNWKANPDFKPADFWERMLEIEQENNLDTKQYI